MALDETLSAAMSPEQSPLPQTGSSAVALWVVEVLFHQKFITLFSMLFGVSIFLVGGEREDRARGRVLRRSAIAISRRYPAFAASRPASSAG